MVGTNAVKYVRICVRKQRMRRTGVRFGETETLVSSAHENVLVR